MTAPAAPTVTPVLTYTPRPPGTLASRAREIAAHYTSKNEGIDLGDGAAAGRLVDELAGKLAQLVAELDRFQAAAVDPAAALLTPCPPPNVAAGDSDCHPGQSWPCPTTRAAWALRGWSADAQVADARDAWRCDMAALDGDFDEEPGCPNCGAPTGGAACPNPPRGTPPGTPSCADLIAEFAQ